MGRTFMEPQHADIVAPPKTTPKQVETEALTFNQNLQLSSQALSVLAFLAGDQEWTGLRVPQFSVNMYTSAWYNGRERGIAVALTKTGINDDAKVPVNNERRLVLVFGEARGSDSIFLDKWTDSGVDINPPTHDDFTDEAYKQRRHFPYGAVRKTAEAVIKEIRKFLGRLSVSE